MIALDNPPAQGLLKLRRGIFMSNNDQKIKKLVSVQEALQIIPCSRSLMYAAIKRGEIAVVKIGRRVFIRSELIDKLLSEPK